MYMGLETLFGTSSKINIIENVAARILSEKNVLSATKKGKLQSDCGR